MSPPHSPGVAGRIVRELPLVLEPVTRDPFIDEDRPLPVGHSRRPREDFLLRERVLPPERDELPWR
jgi:hypothetical protein